MFGRAYLFHRVKRLTRTQKQALILGIDMAVATAVFSLTGQTDLGFGSPSGAMAQIAIVLLAAVSSLAFGLPRIKLNAYGRHAVLATAKFAATVTCGMAALGQIGLMPLQSVEMAVFGLALFLACILSRFAMLTALQWVLQQGQMRRRVLIYGAGDTGLQLALALRNHPRILPIAFLDDDADLHALSVAGLPVLSPARLESLLPGLMTDRVLLAMPSASPARLDQISRKLQTLGLDVRVMPSLARLAGTEAVITQNSTDLSAQILKRDALADGIANVGAAYAGRVILVSGAGGSVGSELCRQLITFAPRKLVLYERCELALYTIEREIRDRSNSMNLEIIPVLGSVTDARLAHGTMIETGVDIVFHAAAYKHVPLVEANPVAGLANNFIGTRVFAEAAVSAGAARFVLISTDKAVRPRNVMGATKRLAELAIHDLAKRSPKTRFSTVRFGNVLGSSGSVMPLFHDQIANGGPVTLTHDDVTRYFMTLAEAANLVLLSGAFAQADGSSSAYVLDMGRPIRIRELAERMILANGLTVKTAANPTGDIEIRVTGLRPGEKLHEDLVSDSNLLPTLHPKIRKEQEADTSDHALATALHAARDAVRTGNQQAARAVLVDWIEAASQLAIPRIGMAVDDHTRYSTARPASQFALQG